MIKNKFETLYISFSDEYIILSQLITKQLINAVFRFRKGKTIKIDQIQKVYIINNWI